MLPRVCLIVVNWNGWRDTIECLESVFRNSYPHYQVVVCDNGSEDNSLEQLKAWASGRLELKVEASNPVSRLTFPPVSKPIPYVECDRALLETEGSPECEAVPLVLVRNGVNLGYAGGANVGLRYALASGRFGFCWLLNNDTVVDPGALSAAVGRMLQDEGAGMCGSTVLFYHEPMRVQVFGGATYNKWTGVPRGIGEGEPFRLDRLDAQKARDLDYVSGVSMLVSTRFVRDVGLMSTRYFLFYEELDWSVRARGRYRMAYAPDSVVYHKQGGTTGANRDPAKTSELADYYSLLSRLIFTSTYYPYALPTVYLGLLVSIAKRVQRGQWGRVAMIGRIVWTHVRSVIFRRSSMLSP